MQCPPDDSGTLGYHQNVNNGSIQTATVGGGTKPPVVIITMVIFHMDETQLQSVYYKQYKISIFLKHKNNYVHHILHVLVICTFPGNYFLFEGSFPSPLLPSDTQREDHLIVSVFRLIF